MSDYSKARGLHTIVTPSERADPVHAKNRGRLISKLARLNHQKILLERLNRVWVEQQQTTLARLRRLQAQIDAIQSVTGIAGPAPDRPQAERAHRERPPHPSQKTQP